MTRILSRNNRYLLAIGGLAVVAVLTVALAYGLTESDRLDIEADAAAIDLMHDTADELYNAVTDQEAAIRTYLLTAEPEALEAHHAAVAQETEIAAAFRLAASDVPAVQAEIDELAAFSLNWQETFADPAIAAVKSGDEAAIDRFSRLAAAGHEAIDEARAPLGEQLDIADTELGLRDQNLANSRLSATAFGLGAMLMAAASALWLIRRYGNALERDALRVGIVNSFTEVASFASDDKEIAASNLTALAMLTKPDAAVTHILNRSKDRAVPEATFGDPIAEIMTLGGLAHCAGLTRSSIYVSNDASTPLSLHCPVYSVDRGTLACIPLISGETVGVVHLYWQRPNALPFDLRTSVVRVAEHAALVIGNRRLLAALQGQANTDPRTGLANSRAFDRALEQALEFRTGEDVISVLMLDLDHFKDFNDRFGHPGGDEALRAFGGVLRSCMRDGDLAARYGGEEFAVFLPGVDRGRSRGDRGADPRANRDDRDLAGARHHGPDHRVDRRRDRPQRSVRPGLAAADRGRSALPSQGGGPQPRHRGSRARCRAGTRRIVLAPTSD